MTTPLDVRRYSLNPPSEPEDNPLTDIIDTGKLETDSATEIDALEAGFKTRTQQEHDRFRKATDSEYWFCVCFTDRAAKDRFLAAHNLTDLGDKYLDGQTVHERITMHPHQPPA